MNQTIMFTHKYFWNLQYARDNQCNRKKIMNTT